MIVKINGIGSIKTICSTKTTIFFKMIAGLFKEMLNSSIMNPSIKVLYVDADACPVKEEIIEVCQKYGIQSIFF